MSPKPIDDAALKAFCGRLMAAHGVDDAQTRSVSDNLVWCDLVGRANHGVSRLPILLERVRRGVLKAPCRPAFARLAPSIELLDGDHGFGHHAGRLAMERAIALASVNGVGVVGVKNSNFFGAGAYFVHLAAESEMIGLAMSNSFPKVAAHGGVMAVLGTNPFAFSAPRRNGESLMVDMAASAAAGSTVRQHIGNGAPLPEGLAIDTEGLPITDPKRVDEGALLPFGGAKGYGLALMVEILAGIITGAGFSHGVASMYKNLSDSGHNGHFLVALDISRFMPMDDYYWRFETFVETIKGSNPDGGVRLPGEVRWKNYRDNMRQGIRLEAGVLDALSALARAHGIATPWQEAAGVCERGPQCAASPAI